MDWASTTSTEEDPEEYKTDDTESDPEEYPDEVVRPDFLESLRHQNLPKYGDPETLRNPRRFLRQMEEKYSQNRCTPAEGVMMIEKCLTGHARLWWKVKREHPERYFCGSIWDQFRVAFAEEFVQKVGERELMEIDSTTDDSDRETSRRAEATEIEGTIWVDGNPAKALFDTGATRSHVDVGYAQEKGLALVKLQDPLIMVLADGSKKEAGFECQGCKVRVNGMDTRATLTASPVKPLDVIIGMDWMSERYAHIDCRRRMIEFRVPGEPIFKFRGD